MSKEFLEGMSYHDQFGTAALMAKAALDTAREALIAPEGRNEKLFARSALAAMDIMGMSVDELSPRCQRIHDYYQGLIQD